MSPPATLRASSELPGKQSEHVVEKHDDMYGCLAPPESQCSCSDRREWLQRSSRWKTLATVPLGSTSRSKHSAREGRDMEVQASSLPCSQCSHLPQEEVTESHLSRCSDDQVWRRRVLCVETSLKEPLGNITAVVQETTTPRPSSQRNLVGMVSCTFTLTEYCPPVRLLQVYLPPLSSRDAQCRQNTHSELP